MATPIVLREETEVVVPPEALWPLIAHTDRMNRAVGLPPVSYRGVEGAPGGPPVLEARARLGPIVLKWEERPFEWIEPKWYAVERVFRSGPIAVFRGGCELRPTRGGTRLTVTAEILPRWAAGRRAAAFIGRRTAARILAFARRAADALGAGDDPFGDGPPARVDAAALAAAVEDLKARGADAALADRLAAHIAGAPDPEVVRMRPFALADRWGAPRMDVLRLLLGAAVAGLVDLKWEIVCPHCRGVSTECEDLAGLPDEGACETCRARFDLAFDEAIEVRFSVHPAIRRARDAVYCRGGPRNTPHIRAQLRIPSGGSRLLRIDLPAGRYLLRAREGSLLVRSAEGAPATAVVRLGPGGFDETQVGFPHGTLDLRVENATSAEAVVSLETPDGDTAAASGALVTSLQEFRDLFHAEALSPGREISIRSLTLLFSDLQGSTALYRRIGDARAYALVRDHFDFMTDVVRRREGAIVKTMGDAVMAVFVSPADAVAAAIEIQETIGIFNLAFRERSGIDPALKVKIGLHRGPMIAVNANGILDYFGTTVNVAARVQGESEGGDVVLTEDLASNPAVADLLRCRGVRAEASEALLRGIERPVAIRRIRLAAPGLLDRLGERVRRWWPPSDVEGESGVDARR